MSGDGLPEWLPPMLEVNPWQSTTYDQLYAVFARDPYHLSVFQLDYRVSLTELDEGRNEYDSAVGDRD
jgi:hypothetical protein